MRRNIVILAALVVLAYTANATQAQEIVQTGACGGPSCGHDCAPETCKHCVPEVEKKKIVKVVYGSKCIDYCLPKCVRGCGKLQHQCKDHGCCASDCPPPAAPECEDCKQCGKVRTRRVLLKKSIDCGEEELVKCKVVETPAVCHGSSCGGTVVVPGSENLAPPTKTPGKTMPPASGALAIPTAPVAVAPAPLAEPISPAIPSAPALSVTPLP